MKSVKLLILIPLLGFFVNDGYAAVTSIQTQRTNANIVVKSLRFKELFKYYNATTRQFTNFDSVNKVPTTASLNGASVRSIFFDPAALEQLSRLTQGIRMGGIDLPYYVSPAASLQLANMDAAIKNKYPLKKYKALEANMFDKNNPWYNLGWVGSGELLLNAALTGPMVGLDLMGSGMSTVAKSIWKTGKNVRKIGKIGSKYSKLVKIGGKFGKNLTNIGTKLAKLKSSPAVKVLKYFDKSKPEGQALVVILKMLDITKAAKKGMTPEAYILGFKSDPDLIKYVSAPNKDDGSALYAYVTKFLFKQSLTAIKDELGSATASFLIDQYQTGVVNIATAPKVDREFIGTLLTDMGLQASELVPVLGPIMSTVNKNLSAAKDINKSAKASIEAFNTFANKRNAEVDLQLNVYKLLMLEDLLREIYLPARTTQLYPNYGTVDQFKGTVAASNRIADDIYDYSTGKLLSKEIHRGYYNCLVAYMKWNKITPVTPPAFAWSASSPISHSVCSLGLNAQTFSVTVDISKQNRAEKKVELYFSLPDRMLYKVPVDVAYEDVAVTRSFYRAVKELGQRGTIKSVGKFYPDNNLRQYEALVMITNLFYRNQYNGYINALKGPTSDAQNRFNFMLGNAGKIKPIAGMQFTSANAPITRGDIAELLMKVIYQKMKAPTLLAVSSVGTVVKYYTGICIPDINMQYINSCTQELWINGFPFITPSSAGILGTIKLGWDVYSTGLKTYDITPGYRGGVFNSTGTITRGEIAGQLIKTFNFIEGHK